MKEKRKELRRLSAELRRAHAAARKADGRCPVRIHVRDDSDFLSPFSPDSEALIAGETAAFLDQSVKYLPPDADLSLHIDGACISPGERPLYAEAIRRYYRHEFAAAARDMRKNTVLSLVMTGVAALIFALALWLSHHGAETVLLNMIDVVAWVFMWEAADIFFFRRSEIRLRRLRAYQMMEAKTEFDTQKECAK